MFIKNLHCLDCHAKIQHTDELKSIVESIASTGAGGIFKLYCTSHALHNARDIDKKILSLVNEEYEKRYVNSDKYQGDLEENPKGLRIVKLMISTSESGWMVRGSKPEIKDIRVFVSDVQQSHTSPVNIDEGSIFVDNNIKQYYACNNSNFQLNNQWKNNRKIKNFTDNCLYCGLKISHPKKLLGVVASIKKRSLTSMLKMYCTVHFFSVEKNIGKDTLETVNREMERVYLEKYQKKTEMQTRENVRWLIHNDKKIEFKPKCFYLEVKKEGARERRTVYLNQFQYSYMDALYEEEEEEEKMEIMATERFREKKELRRNLKDHNRWHDNDSDSDYSGSDSDDMCDKLFMDYFEEGIELEERNNFADNSWSLLYGRDMSLIQEIHKGHMNKVEQTTPDKSFDDDVVNKLKPNMPEQVLCGDYTGRSGHFKSRSFVSDIVEGASDQSNILQRYKRRLFDAKSRMTTLKDKKKIPISGELNFCDLLK